MSILRDTRSMVILALFIALNIVLTRFLAIETPIIRITFSFLPIAMSAMFFGPIPAGMAAAVADIVGFALFARGGTFFPGFTLSAFLTGSIYGFALYRNKPVNVFRVGIAAFLIAFGVNLGLNTYWLTFLTGSSFFALLPPRAVTQVAMFPLQIISITWAWRYLSRFAVGREMG